MRKLRGSTWTAIAVGVAYGVTAQCVIRLDMFNSLFGVMSLGYIFLLPFVLGFVTAYPLFHQGIWKSLGASLATNALCLAIAFAVGWEGTICLIGAAPIYFVMGLLGAGFSHLTHRLRSKRLVHAMMLVPTLAMPLTSAGLETQLPAGHQTRTVTNTIDINASDAVVWQNIARVAPITEPQRSFFFVMGFPRPIEATLSYEGVGAVRHASFERGLLFIETVTRWEPLRQLRFTIDVDPQHTPLTTLDAHVSVGGQFFDVLEGGYRIESLGPGRVRLHLDSAHRISTHYNFYTSLWSDFLMSEIQGNILNVIKQRCEARMQAG